MYMMVQHLWTGTLVHECLPHSIPPGVTNVFCVCEELSLLVSWLLVDSIARVLVKQTCMSRRRENNDTQ